MNPLFDRNYYIPDGEAHVAQDGRLYVYGSWDKPPFTSYCSGQYTVFSTNDMVHWKNHGVTFDSKDIPWNRGGCLYAPDCLEHNGRYYLYFCMSDGSEGVAVSDSPAGPFEKPVRIDTGSRPGIDPSVFCDDDGSVYYFWGQFELNGGILGKDMATIREGSVKTSILSEEEHGFHEGSSIRKRNGIYYLVYTDVSRGTASCLSYATADHPLGPYIKQGVIVDNTGCDPEDWNDHGCIECYKGQWYVFYHRTTHHCQSARWMCAEPIFFDNDGRIREVPMTVSGSEPPLDARQWLDASRADRMSGGMYVTTDSENEYLTDCQLRRWKDSWAEYRVLHFDSTLSVCRIVIRGKGQISVRQNGKPVCGNRSFDCTDFTEYSFPVEGLSGDGTVWFSFRTDSTEEIDFLRFRFE